MWPVCLICCFSFHPAQPREVERIRAVIESHYRASRQPPQPWSEAAGPFVDARIVVLASDWGLVDATLTWIGVFGASSHRYRVAVAQLSGRWRVVPSGP